MDRTTMHHQSSASGASTLVLALIQDEIDAEAAERVRQLGELSPIPVEGTYQVFLLRAGQRNEAVRRHAEHPLAPEPDSWIALWSNCQAAEVAAELGDAALGAGLYRELAPYAGGTAAASASLALGPVDSYLMLAAVAAQETATARRHADDAAAWCRRWDAPLAARGLDRWRSRFGC
jgi:hypothetical protein